MLDLIHDLLWLWVLGAVGGTGYILWAQFVRGAPAAARAKSGPQSITTRRTPAAAPPVARPAGAALPARTPSPAALPPAQPSGSPEHQRRGSAPTVKLSTEPNRPKSDDDDAAELFSGLGAAKPAPVPEPARPPGKDVVDKAGRIEEYGFHVGAKAAAESGVRQADAEAKAAAAATAPAATPTPAAPATSLPADAGAPRSQTQELDDILKRIDAVLSESTAPASEATMVNPQGQQGSSGQQTLPVPTQPPTAKTERSATDPNQQKLF